MLADADHPALVVVDVQEAIDDPRWGPRNNPDAEQTISALIERWRGAGLPVIHVRHDSTEPDSPYRPDQAGNRFKEEAMPTAGEIIVAKSTNSAFIGTDLEHHLRSSGADAVVYAGVLTNNSLEATVRMSGNLGFRSSVVADACWAVDKVDRTGRRWPADDVHAMALANLDGEYATVVDSVDITAAPDHEPTPLQRLAIAYHAWEPELVGPDREPDPFAGLDSYQTFRWRSGVVFEGHVIAATGTAALVLWRPGPMDPPIDNPADLIDEPGTWVDITDVDPSSLPS